MTQILLVRHGQASFGSGNYDVLSPTGERQAAFTGEHLRKLGWSFDAVASGSLQRQRHTAQLAGFAEPLIDEAFNEYPFEGILKAYLPLVAREHPELEIEKGQLFADRKRFQTAFEKAVGHWFAEAPQANTEPLESWQGFKRRVVDGLARLATQERKRVVVFTSGGVIAVAVQAALGTADTAAFALNWRIANASLHRLKLGRNGLLLNGYNDVTHLELLGDEALITYR